MISAKWHDRPILITGGGIGGLSAALALAARGIPSHVLEADAEFSETGAGIQIGPSASRILHEWGLGDAMDSRGNRPDKLTIGDAVNGRVLTEVPLGESVEARYGAPYYALERAQLHRILREKAEQSSEITLTTNFRVLSVRDNGDGVAAIATDGEEIAGAALIGADGAHSQIRLQLFGRKARPSGRIAWRATAPLQAGNASADNIVQLWLSPYGHFVQYGCGPEGPINAVAVTCGAAEPENPANGQDAHELKSHFADWADQPYSLLQNFDNWMWRPLLQMGVLPQWNEGRVTLLGDAAHPILPFLASGAVLAIEDAAVLAAELAQRPDDPAYAFRCYGAQRHMRAARVRYVSAQMGTVYHMRGPMRFARNLALRALSPAKLLAGYSWLYGYRAASA